MKLQTITLSALIALTAATTASADWMDGIQNGYGNGQSYGNGNAYGTGNGTVNTTGNGNANGWGRGNGNADGEVEFTLTFKGKGKTDMAADGAFDGKGDFTGNGTGNSAFNGQGAGNTQAAGAASQNANSGYMGGYAPIPFVAQPTTPAASSAPSFEEMQKMMAEQQKKAIQAITSKTEAKATAVTPKAEATASTEAAAK